MKMLAVGVASRADVNRRFLAAFAGKEQGARLNFATPELLFEALTAKRWEIIKAMCGQGPLSEREIAKRVGRDVRTIRSHVTALVKAGVLDQTDEGIEFPYDAIKVEFTLRSA